jgi:FolB domain-containing protein
MLLKIKNLKLKTIVGVYEWEKNTPREIIVNAEIKTNHDKSCESDNLADAIDYDSMSNKIKNFLTQNRFKLIEKMTNELIKEIMKDQRITKCRLEIDKAGAVDFVESFSVTLEETR